MNKIARRRLRLRAQVGYVYQRDNQPSRYRDNLSESTIPNTTVRCGAYVYKWSAIINLRISGVLAHGPTVNIVRNKKPSSLNGAISNLRSSVPLWRSPTSRSQAGCSSVLGPL
eukprot:7397521-Pyramimonas_sp.AAC.1